jgi:hypothetical protein
MLNTKSAIKITWPILGGFLFFSLGSAFDLSLIGLVMGLSCMMGGLYFQEETNTPHVWMGVIGLLLIFMARHFTSMMDMATLDSSMPYGMGIVSFTS